MRDEFAGMISTAIAKFEELLELVSDTEIIKGFSGQGGEDDLRTWGVVCDLVNPDMNLLIEAAETLGIEHLGGNTFAYTNNLTIDDFKTYRVNSDLVLMPLPPEIIEEDLVLPLLPPEIIEEGPVDGDPPEIIEEKEGEDA